MIKKTLLISLFLLFGLNAICQENESFLIDQSTNPGLVLKEIRSKKPVLEGSYHLFDDWKQVNLTLINGKEIPNVHLNVDLLNDLLDVKSGSVTRKIDPAIIKRISIIKNAQIGIELVQMGDYHSNLHGLAYIIYEDSMRTVFENPIINI